jgi:predicted oxidoreductase
MLIEQKPIWLESLADIATNMAVDKRTVKAWCKRSPAPPIIIMGAKTKRRYRAEFYSLKNWLEKTFSPKNANP